MTTLVEARESATQMFVEGWGTRTPFTLDNERSALDAGTEDWARFTVRHTGGEQETLGPVDGRRFLRRALGFVQIFVPVKQGKTNADGHGQFARGIFEGKNFEGLHFRDVEVREGGQDGRWDITIVEAPFFYEETK